MQPRHADAPGELFAAALDLLREQGHDADAIVADAAAALCEWRGRAPTCPASWPEDDT